jgi:O-antigen/teichoic acid export membrane protein
LGALYTRLRKSKPSLATFSYTAVAFLEKGIGFFALWLLARTISPEEVGIYSVALSWRVLLSAMLTLNVKTSVNIAFFEFNPLDFRRFVSAIVALGWIATCVFMALLFFSGLNTSIIFGLERSYLFLVLLWVLGAFPVEVSQMIWKATYDYRPYTVSHLVFVIGQYVLGFGLLFMGMGWADVPLVWWMLVGGTAFAFGMGVMSTVRLLQRGGWVLIHIKHWRYAVAVSLPLMAHLLAHAVLSRADQIMILNVHGEGAVGLYSVAYRFGELSLVVWAAVNGVWSVWFKQQYDLARFERIRRVAGWYVVGFAVVVVALIGVGALGIRWLLPVVYHETIVILPPIAMSGFFAVLYSFYIVIEYYEKKNVMIALSTALAAGCNVALNALLLPRMGYGIAAWTTLATYVLLFLFHAYYVELRLKRSAVNTLALGGMGLVMVCVAFALSALLSYI